MQNRNKNYSLLSEVQSSPINWIWYPYIPGGKITILQGDPGDGKSTLMMDIIASVTNRKPFPTGEVLIPSNVIFQCSEDGIADTIKPRLENAKADCSKVAYIHEDIFGFSLDDEKVRDTIIDLNAKLLVIDPFQAYLGDSDLSNASSMRKMLRRLSMWASMYDCAVVLIGHLNKKSALKELYRGLGSIDLIAAARSVLQIERCVDNDEKRQIKHIKSSLAPRGKDLYFEISRVGTVQWEKIEEKRKQEENEEPKHTLPAFHSKQELVMYYLKIQLSSGEKEATVLKEELLLLGVGEKTIAIVKKELAIESIRKNRKWFWSLPIYGETDGKEI